MQRHDPVDTSQGLEMGDFSLGSVPCDPSLVWRERHAAMTGEADNLQNIEGAAAPPCPADKPVFSVLGVFCEVNGGETAVCKVASVKQPERREMPRHVAFAGHYERRLS